MLLTVVTRRHHQTDVHPCIRWHPSPVPYVYVVCVTRRLTRCPYVQDHSRDAQANPCSGDIPLKQVGERFTCHYRYFVFSPSAPSCRSLDIPGLTSLPRDGSFPAARRTGQCFEAGIRRNGCTVCGRNSARIGALPDRTVACTQNPERLGSVVGTVVPCHPYRAVTRRWLPLRP